MESHIEEIECPECGKQQLAKVEHSEPFWTYIHQCVQCNYFIGESEWETVKTKTLMQNIKTLSALEKIKQQVDVLSEQGYNEESKKILLWVKKVEHKLKMVY